MNRPVKEILILGGGTAGWLTAGILAAEHCAYSPDGVKISLIESKNISTIGVGEGTWPTMRETLHTIGISEAEFIACCDASFKQGSQFVGWQNDAENTDYYHPFIAPHGFGKTNLIDHWQNKHSNMPYAQAVSSQPHICDNHKAPKQFQTPEYAGVLNYGYHLDAAKFAQLLTKHCTEKLGVNHILDDITDVSNDADQFISSIKTKENGLLSADLYVDCTGLSALLLDKHYNIPLIKQDKVLFNDSALAIQVPYSTNDNKIASHTLSTAFDSGWIWDIGLPTRRGIGCVFSSQHTSIEQARSALESYLLESVPKNTIESLNIRHLTFTPGYREKFWHKNCVAIGMSAGFIEPLEASAIALVELSAKMLAKELPSDLAIMQTTAKRFNQRFSYRWQRVIEFLKLHYVLSDRKSSYWQAHKQESSIPARLQELLELWRYQSPTVNDFTEIEEIFPAASYQYVLYGMGFKTVSRTTKSRMSNDLLAEKLFQENKQKTQQLINGLPSNRALIEQLTFRHQQQIEKQSPKKRQQRS